MFRQTYWMRTLAIVFGVVLAAGAAQGDTFTVNSPVDTVDANPGDGVCADAGGNCTLRAAIEEANALIGTDTIAFNFAGAGTHTIRPFSALPAITDPVIVDGYTQPGSSPNSNGPELGSNTVITIELDGSGAGGVVEHGLRIDAGSSTIRGLAINRFPTDTDAEIQCVVDECHRLGIKAIEATHWADGGNGTTELAQHVADMVDGTESTFKPLYDDDKPLLDKIKTVAQEIYGASDVVVDKKILAQIKMFEDQGMGHYPVCMAKTQYSFTIDPTVKGAPPESHSIPIREVRLSNGAEFLLVVCGDIMTMPGLPRVPAANKIEVDRDGMIQGLF